MSSEPSTLLSRLEKARAKCIRLAEDTNRFLADNGRPTVSVVRADKLRFALMGQYNAGKSTLVNALLGEKAADTGDKPTTREAQTYKFRDFHILDLPGSDARVSEQQEAERALGEAHLVLYVVSSKTGLDYESFWEGLRSLRDSGQPWLLVVNDKQPHPDEASERCFREQLLTRFRSQAREMARLTDLGGQVFWINAESALLARLAEPPKRGLEAVSGIVPLENQVVELLSKSDNFLRNVPRLTDLLKALVDAENEWSNRLDSDESRRLNAALKRCDTGEEKLIAAANEIAQEHFPHLRGALVGLLNRRMRDGNPQALAAEATDLIRGTFQSSIEAFEDRCQAEFQTLAARLGGPATPGYVVTDKELTLNLGCVPQIAQTTGFDWGGLLNRLATSTPAVTRLIEGLTVEAAPTLVQEGAKALVKEGGKQAASALAMQGGKQVARTAAKDGAQGVARGGGQVLGKVLGPAVMILAAGWEIYSGWRKAKEEERQMQAAIREVENIATRAAAAAHCQFLGRASRGVSTVLAPLIHQLREELRARGQQGAALEALLAQGAELRKRLQEVIAELNSRGQE
jgi:small GTP-binding protein